MSSALPSRILGFVLAAVAAAMFVTAGARGGSPGPMMRGDGGSARSGIATGSAVSPDSATLLILHHYAHGRAWSLNGGPFKAHQSLMLARGSTLTVIDNDVMPHRLTEIAGVRVAMRNGTTMATISSHLSRTPGLMGHMGATTTVAFVKAGLYRFRSRAGDNNSRAATVLTVTVTVR